jgi:DNA-binding PadR family transcriptional regulator
MTYKMKSLNNLQQYLPLTETTYFLLLSMASEPRHGYAILKDVQHLSSGRIILSTGTLYGAIKRLVELEWIERFENSVEIENGRPRKEYRLTNLGQQIFNAEFARLQNLVTATQNRISGVSA